MNSLWRPLTAIIIAALAACGGEEAGVGSGGSGGYGLAAGTITGFGSLIVDGERWDDSTATVETEIDPARGLVAVAPRLGQRVAIAFQTLGVADSVRVEPELIGPVLAVDVGTVPPRFTVAGQTVRVNADPDAGPVTVFEGAASIAQLAAGDVVEVHGVRHAGTIQATRIEKLAALPAGGMRIAGIVADYAPAAGTFRLGDLTVGAVGAVVVPANRSLANGQSVVVWSKTPLQAGPRLDADFVRLREPPPAGARLSVSGRISGWDPGRATFSLGSQLVAATGARIVPANRALADDLYVVVSGAAAIDGSLVASQVRIRGPASGDVEVELRGAITHFVGPASFRVRGETVDATGATLQNCPPGGLAAGLFVEVEGRVGGSAVLALRVRCVR
jgi:hypothetical protein